VVARDSRHHMGCFSPRKARAETAILSKAEERRFSAAMIWDLGNISLDSSCQAKLACSTTEAFSPNARFLDELHLTMRSQRIIEHRLFRDISLAVFSFCLAVMLHLSHPAQALSPQTLSPQTLSPQTISLQAITPVSSTPIASNPLSVQIPTHQIPTHQSLAIAQTAALDTLTQGKQHYENGRFAEAAAVWQQAVAQSNDDSLNSALSLSLLSLAQQELGQWSAAQQSIDRSLHLLNQVADNPNKAALLAQSLNTQGSLQLAIGQAEQALETWKLAEQTYAEIEDEAGILGTRINQAQALQTLGLFRRAQTLLQAIAQTLQSQPASSLKATHLRSLGTIWQVVGDLPQSQIALEQSLAIAQQIKAPSDIAAAYFSLGNTYRAQSQDEQALQAYQQAAAIASSAGDRLAAQVNQLSLFLQKSNLPAAQTLFTQQIQPQLAALSASRSHIYTQVHLAASLMEQGSQRFATPETIATVLANAVTQAKQLQDSRAESYALGQLANLYEQTQQWQDAEKLTRQALLLAQSINASDIAYRWQWQLGRLRKYQGDRPAAIAAYSQSVELLKSLRSDLVAINADVQFSFREKVEPVYRELVSLLVEPARPSQADLKQAREIIESLQLAELQNFFRSACLDANPSQIDQVDATAATVYPIILSDRLTTILSIPGQPLTVYSAPVSQTQVEAMTEQALETLNPIFSDSERLQASGQLYDWLIRPAEALLSQHHIKTLVFVLDGELRNMPMAALYDGQAYLVEQYSVAVTPGLQLLEPRSLNAQDRRQVLLGGLTQSRQGFSALPGVATESEQIATNVGADVFLDQKFTEDNLQNQISETSFPLVHLATHGQFSSKVEETFILTWDSRVTIDGLRHLLQTRSAREAQPIELLVLSACQTAEGDKRATLGLAGLAVRSGARSTLATLWAVNDESTAAFMAEFYTVLAQQQVNKAESLRQAQLMLLKNPKYRHPYYWAPFVLIGNWL
jgi:CHAT domain-containing protein